MVWKTKVPLILKDGVRNEALEIFGASNVQFLDVVTNFIRGFTLQTIIELHSYNSCIILYICYTPIKGIFSII